MAALLRTGLTVPKVILETFVQLSNGAWGLTSSTSKICVCPYAGRKGSAKTEYAKDYLSRNPDKSAYWKIIFLISQPKHMFWVLKRTVSMRRFF